MNDPRVIDLLWELRNLRDTLKEHQERVSGEVTIMQPINYYLDGQLVAIDTTVQLILHCFPGQDLSEFQDAQ